MFRNLVNRVICKSLVSVLKYVKFDIGTKLIDIDPLHQVLSGVNTV